MPLPRVKRLAAFVRLGRPLFLGGGFVLYGLGVAVAALGGAPIDWGRYAWGQLIVTAIQLATHYSNDYFDLEADRANRTPTRWSGGSRVLLSDGVPAWIALATAVVLTTIALLASVTLARRTPEASPVLGVALAMMGLAWAYSAPPVRLCARGWGELTTAVVVTLLVPLLGWVLQVGAVRAPLLLAVALPCALQFAMLLAIEFPDAAGDAVTGKRTLVVRLGAAVAARIYAVVTLRGSRRCLFSRAAVCPPRRCSRRCCWRRSLAGRPCASCGAATATANAGRAWRSGRWRC